MKDVVERCLKRTRPLPDGGLEATFLFPPDLEVFSGHFPGLPLVPGVFFIEAARIAAERLSATALRFEGIDEARFTAELPPGETVVIAIQRSGSEGDVRYTASLSGSKGPAGKMRLRLAPRASPPQGAA